MEKNSEKPFYKNQYLLFFCVLVLLTFFMMWCNGPSSSYSGFDFFFHFRRFEVLIDALRNGSYPVYIDYSNADGYGYFTKGFYPDFTLIPFALIGIFTGAYFAYDFMIFTMTILCGVFMYHMVKVIYKDGYAAAITSLLYTFSLYRLFDFYHRGATAEALSFTFLPIVFLGLYYVIKGDYKKWYILAIGYSLLIYTHVIASVLMFVTLVIVLAVNYRSLVKEPKRIAYLFLAGIVALVIVSYYVFPTLEQLSSNSFYLDSRTPGGTAANNKVGFDLILSGFASGITYPKDNLWTGSGILLTLLLFLRFFIKGNKSKQLRSVDIGVIIGLCFTLAISTLFPWGRFPFNILSFIQYPFRLYEFIVFFFAVAGGYYLSQIVKTNKQKVIGYALVVLSSIVLIFVHSLDFKDHSPLKSKTNPLTTETPQYLNRYHTIGGEYFPALLPNIEYIKDRGLIVEKKRDDTQIRNLKRDGCITSLDVEITNTDTIALPLTYYLGYEVTLNDEKVGFTQNDKGLIEVYAMHSGNIKAWYEGTPVQKISFWISVFAMLLLAVYIFLYKRRKNERD